MSLLATRFKNRRLELKMSQAKVAEGICKQGRISRIEQGDYSPGSELLYKLAKKLNVSLDYFFDENVVEELTNLEFFKEQSKKFLDQRDYEGLKYIYNLEKLKNQKLSVYDSNYLKWIDSLVVFYCDKKYEEAIEKIQSVISITSQKDSNYLLFYNTLLIFYIDMDNYKLYREKYEAIFDVIDKIVVTKIEDIEILIKLKYNYCRFLWKNNEDESALNLALETIKLCKKYKTIYLLADLYCILARLSESFENKEQVSKYYQTALVIYELEENEKQLIGLKKYIADNYS